MKAKVALVGVGGYGYNYVENLCRLAEENRIEFVAAAEFAPEKWQERIETLQKHNVRIVKDADELYSLGVDFDLVCLPVGIESHEPLTIQALEHNCNVMVEKPLAGSLAAVENMISARNKTDRFIAVGYQHFYEPALQKVKELLLSGKLGKITKVKLMGRWPRGDAYYDRNYWAGKIFGRHSQILDSPYCNAFAHYINIVLYLAGKSRDEAATPQLTAAELSRSRDIENFDTGIVRFAAGDIPVTAMFTHCCAEASSPQILFTCENGSVYYNESGSWQVAGADGNVLPEFTVPCAADHRNMFETVIKCLTDSSWRICTPEIAAKHVMLMEELYKKAEVKTLAPEQYTIGEKGVRLNKGLAEAWDVMFASL